MGIPQRFLLPVGIVVVFLLVGCGPNVESNNQGGVPASSPPPVILQIGAASYQPGNTLSVTIKNQSQQPVSFVDHQTNCTVLLVERQVANAWESVAPCKRMIATTIHTLNAGESLVVQLTATDQWPAGRYRARLDYGVGAGAGADMSTIVYSSEFRLGS